MELIAIGPDNQRLKRHVNLGQIFWIGREAREDVWAVPWDAHISRLHARIERIEDHLRIDKNDKAINGIFFAGNEQEGEFEVAVGEHFIIGETLFRAEHSVLEVANDAEETPVDLTHFTLDDLREASFRNADERLEVLADLQHVIRGAMDDQSLFSRLSLLVLEGIDIADAVAIVRVLEKGDAEPQVVVEHWDSRDATASPLRPSRRLILEALERQQSVRCLWSGENSKLDYTINESLDWAFCTPITGEAMAGWALYVAGRQQAGPNFSATDLRPDMKFAELVTAVLGALRDVQQLDARHSTLSRFFSPRALPLLTGAQGEDALQPREAEVTVLFCDLRGFSREAERLSHDLLAFLARIGKALDIMTESIHRYQGVVGDFQGDAALAFWGWPLDQPHGAADACRAALHIQEQFSLAAKDPSHPLAKIRFGIGIASGLAAAGKLGSSGRFKIGVFGPVVNLASRLEAITKTFSVPILVDEATVRQCLSGRMTGIRFRKIAHILPYGLEQPLTVSEVLPPSKEDSDGEGKQILSDLDIERYEASLEAFNLGAWDEAIALLHDLPHWDQGKDFLTSFILGNRRIPPRDWRGIIEFDHK